MSSSTKESRAIMAHSVWPWQRSGSTRTFTVFPFLAVVVPLQVAAGVDAQLHTGDVPRFVGGQPQHRVADVFGFDERNPHRLLDTENRLGVGAGRTLQIGPERA